MSLERRIGNLWGATGGSFAGMVYDSKYLAPSITTAQGGGRQPHIVVKENRYGVCEKHPGAS